MNPADIKRWIAAAEAAFTSAKDLDELKSARLAHLGDKAEISLASRSLGSLPAEEKASAGKIIGEGKAAITEALQRATAKLEADRDAKVLLEEVVDITLPVDRAHRGGLHPISIIKNEISDFFIEQGTALKKAPNSNQVGLTLMLLTSRLTIRRAQCKILSISNQLIREWFCGLRLLQFRFAPCWKMSHLFT